MVGIPPRGESSAPGLTENHMCCTDHLVHSLDINHKKKENLRYITQRDRSPTIRCVRVSDDICTRPIRLKGTATNLVKNT